MWSSLVKAVVGEYNSAIRLLPSSTSSVDMQSGPSPISNSVYEDTRNRYPPIKSPCLGVHREYNLRISQRTQLDSEFIILRGWPSRGGIIVLENATPPDFEFLKLDVLDPPLRRDADQTAEDAFCQALLRLGATWWDSLARYDFVRSLKRFDEKALDATEADEDLRPTRRERGWVRVAWPSNPPGALCVLECEEIIMGRAGGETLRPRNYGIISLARTMDERYQILKRMGGTMYASIEDYQGPTFLKAWEDGHEGDRGPLIVPQFIEPTAYGGHPDEALGKFLTSRPAT